MAYPDFLALEAVSRLKALAEAPYDLTTPTGLSPERISDYIASACGFNLLYATQRLDDRVLAELQNLADQAGLIAQFMQMKRGDVMNHIEGYDSEDRQVLHTACRDIFGGSPYCLKAATQAGQQLDRLRAFLRDLDEGRITNHRGESFKVMVQVGIGGSDLGPRALHIALKSHAAPGRGAEFIANVDPDDAAEVLSRLDLATTLVNVVSKSGSTLETRTNEQLIRAAFVEAGLDPARHFIAVTGEGSPMDDPRRYLASFHMYDYIGGRYSATSMVGGVTLAFALGYDNFIEILRGANDMDKASEEPDVRQNPALLMAMVGIWNRNFLGYDTVAVLPYSQALARFPAHLQQCDMESNGKSVTREAREVGWRTGPIVWGEPGTNGQHAFYQLLHQGTMIAPAEFIGFRHCQRGVDQVVDGTCSQQKLVANMLAQSLALAKGSGNENPNKRFPGNRPNSVLIGDKLTPYAMGALLALYENRIAFQGFCWNINSFDQEGVQLGKVLAGDLLAILRGKEKTAAGETAATSPELGILAAAGMLGR